MKSLEAAASVIVIINLSVKINFLCYQYFIAVKNAKNDIQWLTVKINALNSVLAQAQWLFGHFKSVKLVAFKNLDDALNGCFTQLMQIEKQLKLERACKIMSHIERKALKWFFSSKDVNKLVNSLDRYKITILLTLQVNQM